MVMRVCVCAGSSRTGRARVRRLSSCARTCTAGLDRVRREPQPERSAAGPARGAASPRVFMASATPLLNELFTKWEEALNQGEETRALLAAGSSDQNARRGRRQPSEDDD